MNRRRLTLGALAPPVPLLVSACGGGDPAIVTSATPGADVRVVQADSGARLIAEQGSVILDVRTPAELAAGHVEGARILGVNGPGFRDALQKLHRDPSHVVHCQSGNRSAMAAGIMAEAGFTFVTDAGAFADLEVAGVPTGS